MSTALQCTDDEEDQLPLPLMNSLCDFRFTIAPDGSSLFRFLLPFNPYHAEFLKWNNPSYMCGTVHYHFRDIKMKT